MQHIQDESTLKPEAGRELFDHRTLGTDQHADAAEPIFPACPSYPKQPCLLLLLLFSLDNFSTRS